jgi:flagellar hook-associated protein 1 FlgK
MADVYSTAIGAINVNRKDIGFAAHNIANVNVDGYSRLSVEKSSRVIGGTVAGVDIEGIIENVDEVLQDSLYDKIAQDSYQAEIKKQLERMHQELGQPSNANSIDALLNQAQVALKNLSETPTALSSKQLAVQDLDALAKKISAIAGKYQDLRYEMDRTLDASIKELNKHLESAHRLSNIAGAFPRGTLERVNTEDNLRSTLEKIAGYLDISKYTDSSGTVKVLASQGVSIVGESQFFLKYTPTTSVADLVNDEKLNPVSVWFLGTDASQYSLNKDIISEGKSSDVITNIKYGKLAALTYLRDTEIPNALAQLDNLAKNLKDEYNRIHNEGASSNSATTLTGTTLISRDEVPGFSGKARFMLVDDVGLQYDNIPALTIDFSKLDTGSGAGKANLEGILQEINYHFGEKLDTDKSVQLGNLTDIKLVSVSKEITAGGTLDLDIELQNLSGKNATFQILNAAATDGTAANILNSYVGSSYTVNAGNIERTGLTGPSIKLDVPGSITYPFTVTLDVRVNDGFADFDSQLTFTVDSPPANGLNGIKNHRFSVSTADNQGTTFAPNFLSALMSTSMYTADGSSLPVTSSEKGLLQLTTTDPKYHIVIDNLDSSQDGYVAQNIIGTGDKFSYYLGLNDLFVRKDNPANWGDVKNTAMNLTLRSDIKGDANKLSISQVRQLVDHGTPANIINRFEVSEGDTRNLQNILLLAEKKVFFGASGTLSAATVTLQEYASEILGFNTAALSRSNDTAFQANLIRNSIQEKIQNLKGVNINEELANMMIYQQNIVANSRLINIQREIDEVLMNLI